MCMWGGGGGGTKNQFLRQVILQEELINVPSQLSKVRGRHRKREIFKRFRNCPISLPCVVKIGLSLRQELLALSVQAHRWISYRHIMIVDPIGQEYIQYNSCAT